MSYIEDLKDAIRKLHGVESTHRHSVPVKEVFNCETIWDGIVEVFDLHGHQTGTEETRHVTVLHVPPAVSPETAVRTFIIQEFRNAQAEA